MFILIFLYMITQDMIIIPNGQTVLFLFLIFFVWDCMIVSSICSRIKGEN